MCIKNLFLVILAGGLLFTACKKEEKNEKNLYSNVQTSNVKSNSTLIMQMWVYAQQDCVPIEDHCFPTIVVKPTNICYMKLRDAINNGAEHEFFNYTDEAKQLFPFLYEEGIGKEFLPCLLDKGSKLIVIYNKELKKEFYLCVNDELDPKNYKEGMEKLTLQITINRQKYKFLNKKL
ncbi:MAG: hypothetical protein Fur0028_05680 [Bacteroidales bacterium]